MQVLCVVVVLLCWVQPTFHQGAEKHPSELDPSKFGQNPYEGDRTDIGRQNRPESGQLEFFMDSSSDCSPGLRETGDRNIIVHGRGATQSGASPLTCEITIQADTPRDPKKYKIGLMEMDIRDCNVNFYVFDGTKEGALLGRYGCPQNADSNFELVVWTSGNRATFYITRSSREQTLYSIRLWVQTIRSTTDWDKEWPQNPDYNRFFKFEQKWVTLIVGMGYVFVTLMCGLLLLICCCCIRSDGDRWKQARFGLVNPAMNGTHTTKSSLNNPYVLPGSKPRMSNGTTNSQFQRNNSLRRTPVNVKKRIAGGSEDNDSVFESDGTNPNKRLPSNNARRYQPPQPPPPPQPKMDNPQRSRARSNFGRTTDESYVQADDDHPQDMYIQKEIIIPAKKDKKRPKEEYYTSDEELSSGGEEIEKVSSAMNTDPEVKDNGVQYSEPSESESERAESSADESKEVQKLDPVYAKPKKDKDIRVVSRSQSREQLQPVQQASREPVNAAYAAHRPRTPLGDMEQYQPQHSTNPPQQPHYGQQFYGQPDYGPQDYRQPDFGPQDYRQPHYRQPDYGQPVQRQPEYGGPQALPYAGYGSDVQSQPMEHHPGMAPPSYQHSGQYPRYTPEPYYPTYDDNQYHPRPGRRPDYRPDPRSYGPLESSPQDPPIYSYLVRRGYNPVDADHHSPASSHHSLENRLQTGEDSQSANLDSGVEIMRR